MLVFFPKFDIVKVSLKMTDRCNTFLPGVQRQRQTHVPTRTRLKHKIVVVMQDEMITKLIMEWGVDVIVVPIIINSKIINRIMSNNNQKWHVVLCNHNNYHRSYNIMCTIIIYV